KVNTALLGCQDNLAAWSRLRLVEDEILTGDAQGRIQQFLQETRPNYALHRAIWVADATGTVIASTEPSLRGRDVGDREWLNAARKGLPWGGAPGEQDPVGGTGSVLAHPIAASSNRAKAVGAIVTVVDWVKVAELVKQVQVLPQPQDTR